MAQSMRPSTAIGSGSLDEVRKQARPAYLWVGRANKKQMIGKDSVYMWESSLTHCRMMIFAICITITLSACSGAVSSGQSNQLSQPSRSNQPNQSISAEKRESNTDSVIEESKDENKPIYKLSKEEFYNKKGLVTVTQYEYYTDEYEGTKCMSETLLRVGVDESYPEHMVIHEYDDNEVLQCKATYNFNPDGSVSSQSYIDYLYNSIGDLETVNEYVYDAGHGFHLSKTGTYQYNATGNLVYHQIMNMPDTVESTEQATYDDLGRILEKECVNYGSYWREVWKYRADATFESQVYEGQANDTESALLNRIYEYNSNGTLNKLTYYDKAGNATEYLTYHYNNEQRLTQVMKTTTDGASILKYEHIYDENGCCIEERSYEDDGTLYTAKKYEYIQATEDLYDKSSSTID